MPQDAIKTTFRYTVENTRELKIFKEMISAANLTVHIPRDMLDQRYRRKAIGVLVCRTEDYDGLTIAIDLWRGIAKSFRKRANLKNIVLASEHAVITDYSRQGGNIEVLYSMGGGIAALNVEFFPEKNFLYV